MDYKAETDTVCLCNDLLESRSVLLKSKREKKEGREERKKKKEEDYMYMDKTVIVTGKVVAAVTSLLVSFLYMAALRCLTTDMPKISRGKS